MKLIPKKLKKKILNCYCKYVTDKQNSIMYEELTGLYAYMKFIIPHIVISK